MRLLGLVSCLVLVGVVQGMGHRSRDGDDNSGLSCVPCSYKGLEVFCLPPNRLPPPTSRDWVCKRHAPRQAQEDDIWDCLLAASDGPTCRDYDDGACVWCAEPIYGLCVTPQVADRIGALPFFNCDDPVLSLG